MNSTDVIEHQAIGFDAQKYLALQRQAITDRMAKFSNGTLYLEIGGKFLFDAHGQRVLPGFTPTCKIETILGLGQVFEVVFCVNARDLQTNRMITSQSIGYKEFIIQEIAKYQEALKTIPKIAINLVSPENTVIVDAFASEMQALGFKSYKRYVIEGYPEPQSVLSNQGYGKDDYIPTTAPLVLVVGPASNSGKMSTCLGQIYHDIQQGKASGYAKYELFPIWNLPLLHPVNLAYEAATVDIGDFNLVDPFHLKKYGAEVINYNRDVDAFPIVYNIAQHLGSESNYMHTYQSPTDMGMNQAGFAIFNDLIVAKAAYDEIVRRRDWAEAQATEGRGESKWTEACENLRIQAEKYLPK